MTGDELHAMIERARAEVDDMIATFVAGRVGIEDIPVAYQMRALVERIAKLEERVRRLERDAQDAEGDPSTDYPMGVIL